MTVGEKRPLKNQTVSCSVAAKGKRLNKLFALRFIINRRKVHSEACIQIKSAMILLLASNQDVHVCSELHFVRKVAPLHMKGFRREIAARQV